MKNLYWICHTITVVNILFSFVELCGASDRRKKVTSVISDSFESFIHVVVKNVESLYRT